MKNLVIAALSFIWGGVIASAWWQAAMFGHGDAVALWAIPAGGTIASLIAIASNITSAFDSE